MLFRQLELSNDQASQFQRAILELSNLYNISVQAASLGGALTDINISAKTLEAKLEKAMD